MKKNIFFYLLTTLFLLITCLLPLTAGSLAELKTVINKIPDQKIALLPPNFQGPAFEYAKETGLMHKMKIISPEQLINTAEFTAKNFPVAVFMGGEHYITTVKSRWDVIDSMKKYLGGGGQIVLLSYEPWPMYTEIEKGKWTDNVNVFIEHFDVYFSSFENPPKSLTMKFNNKQNIIKGLPNTIKFPESGDQRLRAIDPYNLTYDAKLTSILSVNGYGDAIGLIEFVDGECKSGKILYVWFTLLHHDYKDQILNEVFTYIAAQCK